MKIIILGNYCNVALAFKCAVPMCHDYCVYITFDAYAVYIHLVYVLLQNIVFGLSLFRIKIQLQMLIQWAVYYYIPHFITF